MNNVIWLPLIASLLALWFGARMLRMGLRAIEQKDKGNGPLDLRFIVLPGAVLVYVAVAVFIDDVLPHWLE